MSSRALRRLERLKNLQVEESSDSDSTYEVAEPQKSFNAFANLGPDSDSDDNDEEEKEEEKREQRKTKIEKRPTPNKSNKRKGKSKAVRKPLVDSDEELDKFLEEVKKRDQQKNPSKDLDTSKPEIEIDESQWDFYDEEIEVPSIDANFCYFTIKRMKQLLGLLSIDSIKNLDPDNEIKNLLGNLSAEIVDDANSTTSFGVSPEVLQQFKHLARLTRGWGGKDRRSVPGTSKKLLFTRVKDDYLPTAKKPLGMEEITSKEMEEFMEFRDGWNPETIPEIEHKLRQEKQAGIKYFKFSKSDISPASRLANTRFYAAVVMTPDPDSLIRLVQEHPYHPETSLQVAMVLLRQGSDKSASNALIERALFTFDRSLHKSFHEYLQEGKNELLRLPYERYMNRQFYLCLFRFISILGERSTFFTAWTYAKLLLSINPTQDPLGVRYFIDFYAIMSEQYEWLIKFGESPLVLTYKWWYTPGIAFSLVLAYLRVGNKEKAKDAMKRAFHTHRYLSLRLLEQIGLSSEMPKNEKEPDELEQLGAETYLIRAALLWKDQEERSFLHDELVSLFQDNARTRPGLLKSWLRAYQGNIGNMPHNLLRFAILSGENKLMANVPRVVWSRSDVLEYDVLPPKDETTEYNHFSGIGGQSQVVDELLNYVDQNLLGAIIQNQSGDDGLQDIIARLQMEDEERGDEERGDGE